MGANGMHASGALEYEDNRKWRTVDSIGDNIKILEMKPSSPGKRRPGVKLPEESRTSKRVYVVMYPKDDPKYNGIKAIAQYGDDGKKVFEIHTSDHKGMGIHHHIWNDGRGGPAVAGLTDDMRVLYEKVINHGQ